jgi:hypothetical protein
LQWSLFKKRGLAWPTLSGNLTGGAFGTAGLKAGLLVQGNFVFGGCVMRITAPDNRNIDSLIRTWIAVAAAVVAWLVPIPWYCSVAIFLAVLLPLGIFYPLLTRPRK